MGVEPGTLLSLAIAKTKDALNSGALQPIATEYEYLESGSIRFLVRILTNSHLKSQAKKKQKKAGTNPFLPYDPNLWVADLSPTHLCLLNKFNAVDHHLLIVTRAFASQDDWLNEADFAALWIGLQEIDGLGFYNGGKLAGSSQPHKHLQLIPLPLSPEGSRLPIDGAVEAAIAAATFNPPFDPQLNPQLDPTGLPPLAKLADFGFVHGLLPLSDLAFSDLTPCDLTLSDLNQAATKLHYRYQLLLTALGLPPFGTEQTGAYNLLVTRDWMMIVLRSQESCQSIAVNSLGFAGALLVKNSEQLAQLKTLTPLGLLQAVALPNP